MNPSPVVTYECYHCGATFSSELGRRAHDAVCIPRNMPAKELNGTNELPLKILANLSPNLIVGNQTVPGLEQGEKSLVLIQFQ